MNENIKDLEKYFIEKILPLAVAEDIGSGDITTSAVIPPGVRGRAIVEAKEKVILCGISIFAAIFETQKSRVYRLVQYAADGQTLSRGDRIAEIEADLELLLNYERLALNVLQRLSGIATLSHSFAEMLKGSRTKILDTRKTTPGYRCLEKYAVRTGGASNHRMGLYDAFLIKDNHISAAGSIAEAVKRTRAYAREHGKKFLIEIECKTSAQVEEALQAGADIIMLDNMDDLSIKRSVAKIENKAKIEISGNIIKGRLANLARMNIDYISSGSLTHSAHAADLSMNII